ncbi:hypothetical protein C8Q77DRAFT_862071 [Trametes polyzona]|nr:hypothetical protein C8Q77DRAFT_862071 [Trametes polyzona]
MLHQSRNKRRTRASCSMASSYGLISIDSRPIGIPCPRSPHGPAQPPTRSAAQRSGSWRTANPSNALSRTPACSPSRRAHSGTPQRRARRLP